MTVTEFLPLRGQTGQRSQALALMFITGSLLALVTLALPGADEVDQLPWAVNSALALPVGGLLWLHGHRLPEPAIHAVLVAGAVIVAGGITFGNGGSYSVAACFFFVWVALYTFLYFRVQLAVAHLVIDTGLLVAALAIAGVEGVAAVALMITGTAVVVGTVVGRARWELDRLARTDPLTGLQNRRALEEALQVEASRTSRSGVPYSVVLLDLDDFKTVNDSHGHQAGDDLLVGAARRWRECLRPIDVLVRYGGDEFVAVLPGCGQEEATAVAERMRQLSPGPCSCGVATWRPDDSPEDVLHRADQQLYAAKGNR